MLVAGLLPFGAVFIELFFIFTAIWQNQFYYLFGFLFLVFVILVISCAQISIVMIYFQLCAEVRYRVFLFTFYSPFWNMFSWFIFFIELSLVVEVAVSVRRLGRSHVLLRNFLFYFKIANYWSSAHFTLFWLHRHNGPHILAAYVHYRILFFLFLHQKNLRSYKNRLEKSVYSWVIFSCGFIIITIKQSTCYYTFANYREV